MLNFLSSFGYSLSCFIFSYKAHYLFFFVYKFQIPFCLVFFLEYMKNKYIFKWKMFNMFIGKFVVKFVQLQCAVHPLLESLHARIEICNEFVMEIHYVFMIYYGTRTNHRFKSSIWWFTNTEIHCHSTLCMANALQCMWAQTAHITIQ